MKLFRLPETRKKKSKQTSTTSDRRKNYKPKYQLVESFLLVIQKKSHAWELLRLRVVMAALMTFSN